ncbi:MAG: hypothetical protein Q8R12_03290 [bacterium]|nr:hypothetical protein [bacterium]
MKRVVLTKRSEDVHACLEKLPEIWGCGRTSNEAIGNMISAHYEKFDLFLAWNGKDEQTMRYLESGVEPK